MVDMHIHTHFSDGRESVPVIFEKANKLGISTISITDHNNILAYKEIINSDIISTYKGDIITGAELKCHMNKEIIELLVYDFKLDEMQTFIDNNYHSWEYINKSMSLEFANILKNQAIAYDEDLMHTHDFGRHNGVMEIYKSVLEIKENGFKLGDELYNNIPEFFRKCVCDENSRFYIDLSKYYPSVEKIFNFVKTNSGKVVMPHVYFFNNGFNILKDIQKVYDIDGVECYHPSYTKKQCDELLEYAKNHNLYITAGSDYHGSSYKLGEPSEFYDKSKVKLFEFENKIN